MVITSHGISLSDSRNVHAIVQMCDVYALIHDTLYHYIVTVDLIVFAID